MDNLKPDVAAYLNRIGYDGPLDGSAKAWQKNTGKNIFTLYLTKILI